MKTTGVIVARFQTPYLHKGHTFLLDAIQSNHNKIVIVLGISAVKGSIRNPFDFYTREKMLKAYNPDLIILPLQDHSSDEQWSINLDNLLRQTFPAETFVLYGSRDCFIPYYSGHFEVQELPAAGNYSATSIREANADKVRDTEDFRMGINYAYHNTYKKVYATVDVALLNANSSKVLLGKKHNAKQWRFPGGFTDVTDLSYEAAAKRELSEECGSIETGNMIYLGSARIDDWRYRSEADKIITTFFKTNLLFGEPAAGDDLAEVQWFNIDELKIMINNNQIAKEHFVLVNMLLNYEKPENIKDKK